MVFGSKVREKGAVRKVARPHRPGRSSAGRLLLRLACGPKVSLDQKRTTPSPRPGLY